MGLKGFLQSAIWDGPDDIDVVGYVTLGLADVLELFSQVLVYLLIFGQELIDLWDSAEIELIFLGLFLNGYFRSGDGNAIGLVIAVYFALVLHWLHLSW